MILKDISLKTPVENILYDEALLRAAEKGQQGEVLRFWESKEIFIVMGLTGKLDEEVYVEQARREEVTMLRRYSGGGTVVQGPGCLNFALILDKKSDEQLRDIRRSYAFILYKVRAALFRSGIESLLLPLSDLAYGSGLRKFSGNAQHRGKNYILHHGTILYAFDLACIEKYLKMPPKFPEYRSSRKHQDFVTNISLEPEIFKEQLCLEFDVQGKEGKINAHEQNILQELSSEKRYEASL